jgi:hypothetical protein
LCSDGLEGKIGIDVGKWEEMTPNKKIFYRCSIPGQSPSEVLHESEIADQSLVNFIGGCWDLFQLILEKLQTVWRTIRGPNDQEIKWLELIKGRSEADAIRIQAYQERHSLKKNEKRKRIALARKEIVVHGEEIQELIYYFTESVVIFSTHGFTDKRLP